MSNPVSYGTPHRGISETDVSQAADAIFKTGVAPTVRGIRTHLGVGSFNTITPLLNLWWKRIASRLGSGPAALDRLPESIARIAEAFWLQALEEGRARVRQELTGQTHAAAADRQDLEVRSHVLSLREGEMESRLEDKNKQIAGLKGQLEEYKVLWRRERATTQAIEREATLIRKALAEAQEKLAAPKSAPKQARVALKGRPRHIKRRRAPSAIAKIKKSRKKAKRASRS